jgi:hypothetical protein
MKKTAKKKAKTAAGSTAKTETIHRRIITKRVRIGQDADTKTQKTTELVHKLREEEAIDAERKQVAKGYSDKMKALAAEIVELRETVDKGELVDMEVEETKNFKTGKVTYKRTDTDEELPNETRDITEEDSQLELGGATDEGEDNSEGEE